MVSRRKFVAGAMCVPSFATGVAFGREEGGSVSAAAQDSEKVDISLWFDVTGGAETAECIVAHATQPFNAQSDSVEVEATLQANGWNATRTALAGGGGPDTVVTPGPSWALELASAGQIAALDEFIEQYGWAESFVPWALDLGRVDGTLYSLPSEQETMLLYYNATLFEDHGWPLPTTMDQLVQLCEQIASEGIIPFAHGNQEWRPANHWYLGEFLNHVAGPQKVYDFLTGKAQLTDPEFVSAVDLINEFQQKGWFMGGLESYYTTGSNEFQTALGDGDAAMSINGTWFMSDVNNFFGEEAGNSNDWGWIPVPSTSGEPIFDIGIGTTYSINGSAERKESVAEYLSYQFSPEVQALLFTECGVAPAPVDLEGQNLEGVDPRHSDAINQLNEAAAAGNYGYLMWTFFSPKTDSFLTENIERVWSGDMTSKELLERAQEIHNEDAAAGLVPPIPERGADESIEVVSAGTPVGTP